MKNTKPKYSKNNYSKIRDYIADYNRKHYRFFGFRLKKGTDDDLIEFLEDQELLNEYIVDLIKNDYLNKQSNTHI